MNESSRTSPEKHNHDDEKKREAQKQRRLHFSVSYLVTSLLTLWLFQALFFSNVAKQYEISYSDFKTKLASGQIVNATVGERSIIGQAKNPSGDKSQPVIPFSTIPSPNGDPNLIAQLQSANVTYSFERPPNPLTGALLQYVLPLVLLAGFYYVVYRRAGDTTGAGFGGVFGVGKSKAIEVKPEDVTVTFNDVGGADEAIGELQEIIEFLTRRSRNQNLAFSRKLEPLKKCRNPA